MNKKVIDIFGCGHVFYTRHVNFLPKEFDFKIFDLNKKSVKINGKTYVTSNLHDEKSNIICIFTPPNNRKNIFELYNLNIEKIFIEKPVFLNSDDIISFEKNIGKEVKIFDGYIRNNFNHLKLIQNLIKDQKIKKISFFEQKKWSPDEIPKYLDNFKSNFSIIEVLPHYLSMIFSLNENIKIKIKTINKKNIFSSKIIFEIINCDELKEIEVIISMSHNGLSGSILETSENNYYVPLESTNKIYLLNKFKLKIGELESYFYESNHPDNIEMIVMNLWDNFVSNKQPDRDFEFHKKIGLILEEPSD